MSKLFPDENEKDKEIKETSETESYDGYENEAMENAEEGSFLEEVFFSKTSLPSCSSQITRSVSSSEKETGLERSLKDSRDREKFLMEKWFSVTGKKPRNIPVIEKYYDEAVDRNRRSDDADKKREQKLLLEAKRLQNLKITFGKVRQEIRMPVFWRGMTCIKFSPDANFVALSDLNGTVEIRHCSSGELAMTLNTIEHNENLAVSSLKYFPGDNEKLFLGGDSGVIQVFNPVSGRLDGFSDNLGVINVLDISPNGSVLATGGKGGTLVTVDPLTLQAIWTAAWPNINKTTTSDIGNNYHKLRIYALKFHPTETHLFVTGGCDGSVKIWDVRIPKAICSIRGPNIFGEGVDLLDDRIITASWRVENSLSLWHFPSGQLIKNISIQNKATKYESEFLYCAQFFRNVPAFDSINSNMVAVGGSGFTELLVINTETEKVLTYFPSFKSIVTLDICGNLIAYGGKESNFRIGEIENKRKARFFYK